MPPTDIVCLCQRYDLKGQFGPGFAGFPEVRLLNPDEVSDPASVRYALAFLPEDDAFARFPNLAMVCSVGAGVDGLLVHPGLPAEMPVVRMVNPEQAKMMAGCAVYHVVGWHRRLVDYPAQQRAKVWQELDLTVPSTFPVGVLGFGNMGRAVCAALGVLGYPVRAWAGRARTEDGIAVESGRESLGHLLGWARAVVNVLPLTEATTGILNAETFAEMRADALLVQIGRGAHVVEPDLLAALDAGRPGGAVLDVMMQEPLPQDSPLWTHPKIQITPHMASENSPEAVAGAIAGNIARHQQGEAPVGLVDRARGY